LEEFNKDLNFITFIKVAIHYTGQQGSSVSVVTLLRAGQRDFDFRQRQALLFSLPLPDQICGSPSLLSDG